ncbi:hypothetical protein GCM10010912_31750 [Paenibacillus albidus]|uniref:ComX pheromone n=2 Tax=Paenibacillus albidus TaxID=2041023 RepID=A0A917CDQ4_9BACL|nr:competence pheromone ComX [Paenibacillus albidus]GGF84175.1 hypothetical protein GCM10010912_31750 [Paenibacillus albidus]
MLKEMFEKLVKNPEARLQFQNGQLQMAGMTTWERKALMDVMRNETPDREVNEKEYHYWM